MNRSELIKKLLGDVSMIKLGLRAHDPLVPLIEPQRYEEYDFLESLLLAEQKREKGCDMCMPEEKEEIQIRGIRAGITKRKDYETSGSVEYVADFCPHCGRRLTDGESE